MKKYNCESCNFHTDHKPNYLRHLRTSKHNKSSKSHQLVTPKSPISHQLYNNIYLENFKPFTCHYCNKGFNFKQGMYRHIKYTCRKNKDEDFKELARLLNEKEKQMKDKDKKLDNLLKQISKLTNKLQIQNINNGLIQNNNNNVVNIQLLNHNDTDYSHLTPSDYITCLNDCNKCVKTLIEKVHFNDDKPENMNIYISSIKGRHVLVYKDNVWQIQDRKRQIDDLYDNNEVVLESWYDEYKEKYPNIIESFQRYLKNRDEDVVLNNIKEEILLMLYNKRNMVAIEG
tara:strand:+ start:94 stop:951 length:858 start_codon:yes stop_codon:yes gene_type:complete